jgi:hypothetical protein
MQAPMKRPKTRLDHENEKAAYMDGHNMAHEGFTKDQVMSTQVWGVWFDEGHVHSFMKGFYDAQKRLSGRVR